MMQWRKKDRKGDGKAEPEYLLHRHTYPCMSMFLEKLIGLFLTKLACLIRNNRPD